jgi:hypothetical protein
MSDDYPRYVFYPYHDDKYGFWIEIDDDRAISLFENTPEHGMWLDPVTDESEYAKEEPTETLRELVGKLVTQESVDMRPYADELPEWERHFVSVIHGTINNKDPDNIPELVWDWMHDCRE